MRISKADLVIDSSGNANGLIQRRYYGLQYDEIFSLLHLNSDEQKKWLYDNSSFPSLRINNYTIQNVKQIIPFAIFNESFTSFNYCSSTGKYLVLPLNRVNFQTPIKKC